MSNKKFQFYTDSVSLIKAETPDYYEIEGLASTEDEDLQNEIVEQKGLNIESLKEGKGYLNSDHGHGYENKDLARMGLIDEAKITKDGLYIKGKIWKNHPEAGTYYNELKYGKPGVVQFSVEGHVMNRDPFNKNKVKQAYVAGVALTRNPINRNTYAKLAKSLTSDNENDVPGNVSELNENEISKMITYDEILDRAAEKIVDDVVKGGIGSGRKNLGLTAARKEERKLHDKRTNEIVAHKKESGKEHREIPAGSSAAKDHAKEQEQKMKEQSKHTPKPKKSEFDVQFKEREAKKRLKEVMAEQAGTEAQAKEARQAAKKIGITGKQKKRFTRKDIRVQKSELYKELLRRANISEEFKKSLDSILEKALSTGGPLGVNAPRTEAVQGQVFQLEEEEAKKKKKKKDQKN